ncbi:MAG: hypothetical protein ACQ9CV_04150 [Nitrosopumilus sp.]|jgi:hypothetical protein
MNTATQNPAFDSNPEILDGRILSLYKMTNDVMMKIKTQTMENSL